MPTDRGSRAFVSVASWSGRLVHVHEALSKGTAGVAGGDPPSADGAHRAAVRRSQIAGVPPHDRAANLPCTDQRLRLQLDPLALSGDGSAAAIGTAVEAGLSVLECGRSVALYTAMGPSADRGGELDSFKGARHRLGRALGHIHAELVSRTGLSRAVVAGGDTSSHALGEMGISALTLKMPLPQTPGSPLCIAHGGPADGLQIALKGGQVGGDDYFSMIRAGEV